MTTIALNIVVTFIVTFVTLFFMFRLGFMVGRNVTQKKLFPALSEDLQRAIDRLIAEYHGSNCGNEERDVCDDHFYNYQQVRTMLVIALITVREGD